MSSSKHSYKRSWRNLLINKRYQLRFTLFMVGLSGLLMAGLGVWVMRVANETTEISKASVRGTPCPKIPSLTGAAEDEEPVPLPPMRLEEGDAVDAAPAPVPAGTPAPSQSQAPGPAVAPATAPAPADPGSVDPGDPAAADAADDDEDRERRRRRIKVDSTIDMLPPPVAAVPPDWAKLVVAHHTCKLRLAGKIDRLESRRLRILWVLIGTGLVLVFGLAVYGIKMTHRVAGPLFKVGLYHAKMRDGRFDKVWNLRKGDQLVEFYEHFKAAHAGVIKVEQADIDRLRAVIAAAEAAGAGGHAMVGELRELLARKEKSLE